MQSQQKLPEVRFDPQDRFEEGLASLYKSNLTSLAKMGMIPEALDEVILSYDYVTSVAELDPKVTLATSPRFSSSARLLHTTTGQQKLVVNATIHYGNVPAHIRTLAKIFVNEMAPEQLPSTLKSLPENYHITSFRSITEVMLRGLCAKIVAELKLTNMTFEVDGVVHPLAQGGYETHEELYEEFVIKCQRIHWAYQATHDLTEFVTSLIGQMQFSLRRTIEILIQGKIKCEIPTLLFKASQSALECFLCASEDETWVLDLKDFSNALKFLFEDQGSLVKQEEPFEIKITSNPKGFYFEKAMDAVPCIFAFVDILGFSEAIDIYTKDPNTDLLFKASRGLRRAIEETKQLATLIFDDASIAATVDIRVYSDNVSISFPYFETSDDFSKAVSLVTVLSSYMQHTILAHGFLCRGAISYGPHFADKSTMFSMALVNAHRLEQLVQYPAIILDPKLLSHPLFDQSGGGMSANLLTMEHHPTLDPFVFVSPIAAQFLAIDVHARDPQFQARTHPYYDQLDQNSLPNFEKIRQKFPTEDFSNPIFNLESCIRGIRLKQIYTCDENIDKLSHRVKQQQKWKWFRNILIQSWNNQFSSPYSRWTAK